MLYYVYIQDDKITTKGNLTKRIELSEGYKEVTKEIYDSIGAMPCSFVETDGVITSVEYIEPTIAPEPPQPPSEIELLKQENEQLKQELAQVNADLVALSEMILSTLQ